MIKNVLVFISIILLTFNCTTRKVSDVKEKIVYVDKIKRDSIFIRSEVVKTDTLYNEIIVDCDSVSSFNQKLKDGKNTLDISKNKDNKVVIKYLKEPTENKKEYVFINKQEKKDSISETNNSKNIVKEDIFKTKVYEILFYFVLILWALGITPKYLFNKFI